MDHKKSTKEALDRYFTKLAKPKRNKKNLKPEKEVEHQCVEWMRAVNWDVGIYEAKASYNPYAGRYISRSMQAGTVDCQGVMPNGIFVAVEFKAPGRLKTFNSQRNYRQKEYIVSKILSNAFAVVVDSKDRLEQIYATWKNLDENKKKDFLMASLP